MTLDEKYNNYKKQGLKNYFDENFSGERYAQDLPKLDDSTELSDTFCTPNICANCRGHCCQTYPCAFSPEDFIDINDMDYMRNILDLGLICISLTETDFGIFWYLRPMGIIDCLSNDNKSIVSTKYTQNECCILRDSETGCMLSATYRPREGLLHYPIPDNTYREDFPKYYMDHITWYTDQYKYREWKEYQKTLETLAREYRKGNRLEHIDEEFEQKVIRLTRRIAGYNN